MARFFGALILLTAGAASGYGQTPTPTATPQAVASVKTPTAIAQPSVKLEDLRRSIEQLTPEQQQKVLQNLHRWLALSPDERDVLRQRQRVRQQKEEESVTDAYQKSGLRLNEEGREIFRKLYLQERRKLEEQLAKESQEKRQKGDAAIVEKLKKEFANSPNASATNTQR
ncbi:MAG TPA: hypothetical protein VFU37_21890 [Pyrinomonadaceae bacterium]|nr:hypothetical protein [Pyrinomonadaceae bacterium]